MKKVVKKKTNDLVTSTFLDKKGKTVNVSDIIDKDDCWYLKRANSWILSHKAIKKIANVAGISKNYIVEESNNIVPDYKNELEHIIRVTIKCNAKRKAKSKKGCIHSDEDTLTVTGEANRINTPNRGRGYLRKMAEKRAFDIAVLEHLDLYSSVFSEEEAASYESKKTKEPDLMPGTIEFENIVTEINAILNAKKHTNMKKVAIKIKKLLKENKYTFKQIKYLRELYKQEYGKRNTDL